VWSNDLFILDDHVEMVSIFASSAEDSEFHSRALKLYNIEVFCFFTMSVA